jgi:phosphate transport system protein
MVRSEFHAQLAALRAQVLELGGLAMSALERVIEALQENDRAVAETIVAEDAAIDTRHAGIQKSAISTLARQQPTARDLRAITAGMMIATELERIGDYATGTARLVLQEPNEPPLPPSHDLYRMARAARRMLQRSLDAYATADATLARQIWNEDPTVDEFQRALYQALLVTMIENPSTLTRATHLLWTVHNLERVADRATNICEQTIFMVDGEWPSAESLHDPMLVPEPAASDTID